MPFFKKRLYEIFNLNFCWHTTIINIYNIFTKFYSKTCLEQPLKKDKTKVLKTNGSLMKVESIAECSHGAFCNTFDLYYAIISLENQSSVFFLSGDLRQV